jgi:hypothetical protein
MKTFALVLAGVCSLLFTGCYTGSQFTIEASHLEQPVSMTSAIHNADLEVLTAKEYDDLGRFSISFSGWSVGSPVSPNPRIDISEALNDIVKKRGGNGVTDLTLRAANHPVNFVSMFLRGVSWLGLVIGTAMMVSSHTNRLEAAEVMVVSVAGILFLPTVGSFTMEGRVVRIKQKTLQ